MAAIVKVLTEAGLKEPKVILDWTLDFRKLQAYLPHNKFTA